GVCVRVNRAVFDLAGEGEGRLGGEVHGRADVLADVEPFADRDLQRNGFWQLAFGDLAAVHRHGHGAALAELARLAAVGEIDPDLYLALRERSASGDGIALDREEVVDERRLAVPDI